MHFSSQLLYSDYFLNINFFRHLNAKMSVKRITCFDMKIGKLFPFSKLNVFEASILLHFNLKFNLQELRISPANEY